MNKTPLYDEHVKLNAKIVDFHGWLLPIQYTSQIEEHHQVRQAAGIFDVSHMTVIDLQGTEVEKYLRFVLANDVAKLVPGKALYTAMLNEQAGIIDDLIAYKNSDDSFRLVVNSATREQDLAWLEKQAQNFQVTLTWRSELAIVAIQGPLAREKVLPLLPDALKQAAAELKPFQFVQAGDWQVSRTGYTGEDGFEVILPAVGVASFWQQLVAANIIPCGLGARDTLRLEAGLNLYGQDMDETVSPLESNIAWTITWEPVDRNFIGRQKLDEQKRENAYPRLVGLLMQDKGIPRTGYAVFCGDEKIGVVTSGTFSPTMQQGIAMARVKLPEDHGQCFVEIRDKKLAVKVVKLPFVRNGKIQVQ